MISRSTVFPEQRYLPALGDSKARITTPVYVITLGIQSIQHPIPLNVM